MFPNFDRNAYKLKNILKRYLVSISTVSLLLLINFIVVIIYSHLWFLVWHLLAPRTGFHYRHCLFSFNNCYTRHKFFLRSTFTYFITFPYTLAIPFRFFVYLCLNSLFSLSIFCEISFHRWAFLCYSLPNMFFLSTKS